MNTLCGRQRNRPGIFSRGRGHRVFVGLEKGETGLPYERSGKRAEGVLAQEIKERGLQVHARGIKKALPFLPMLFKEFLPSVESPDRDIKGFADPFHRSEAEGVLCEDAEDKTEAVAAVRDDGIREDRMRGKAHTGSTDKTADVEDGFNRPVIDKIDQGTLVIGMNAQTFPAPAMGTDLILGLQMIHTFGVDGFS